MKKNIFGNFNDKSTFIESFSKVNNCLESFLVNSKFPDLDEEITLDSFLTQILPNLTKSILIHITDKKIANESFFSQVNILIHNYLSLIQNNYIKISSLLLQILISIYSNFPSFYDNDLYNISDNFTIDIISHIFKLSLENANYLDIFILVLTIILLKKDNIDLTFVQNYLTEFEKHINTFNYQQTDSSIFIQIFCIFDQTLASFSNNESDQQPFFDTFLNFSIKALQLCQSIEKQKATLRFIDSKIKGIKYLVDTNTDNRNNNNPNQIFDFRQASDSIDAKSNSLDIVDDFSISNESVTNNPLFISYVLKSNPLISLIDVDGHKDILQEVNILIQKICKIYQILNSIPDQITTEILSHFASRIESSYRTQKQIFVYDFITVFNCLCSESSELAIEFLKKTKKSDEQEKEETNENDKNTTSVVISNSTLFEIGKSVSAYKPVLNYIINIFETNIYEKNDADSIPYVVKLCQRSDACKNKQLNYCLSVLKSDEKNPQEVIFTMLAELVSISNYAEIAIIFNELLSLFKTRDDENFRKLIENVIIKSKMQLNKNDGSLLIQKFCNDDEGWKTMCNIFSSRKMTFLSNTNSWIYLLNVFNESAKTPNSLSFLKQAFPYLYENLLFKNYTTLYSKIFNSLFIEYVEYENYSCLDVFIYILSFLGDSAKKHIYKNIIDFKLRDIIINEKIENRHLAIDFFRFLIEKIEWNMEFTNFKDINMRKSIKTFSRLKEIKKPSDAFTINVSCNPIDSHEIRFFNIDVTPDTMINDICIYFGVGFSIASRTIEIRTLGDDYYYNIPENNRNDSMYIPLPNTKTLKELDINEETDLKVFYAKQSYSLFDYKNYFPSEIISISKIPSILLTILSNSDDKVLTKSAWKLLELLIPFSLDFLNLVPKDKFYCELLFLKTTAFSVKNDPRFIHSNFTANFAPILVNMIINENLKGKLLKAALTIISYCISLNDVEIDGQRFTELLIRSFIEAENDTLIEKILTVFTLLHKANITNFEYYFVHNDLLLDKCISLYSSSYNNSNLVTKLFSNFNQDHKKNIFDYCMNVFLEKSVNCFVLLKTTYTSECEVKDLFNKCIKIFLEDNDDNHLNDQYISNLSSLISFLLSKRSSLISESSSIAPQLIKKAFSETSSQRQKGAFSIISHYINSDENKSGDKENAIRTLSEICNSLQTTRTNYDPSLHKKKNHYCGLKSLGMTCYMNSILQQIAHNDSFRKALFQLDYPNSNPIVTELQKLVAMLELSDQSAVETRQFADEYKQKARPDFNPKVQEDAAEFLEFLRDNLPKELQKTFEGEYIKTFEGQTVHYSSSINEAFYSFAIPVNMKFPDAMKLNLEDELFTGNNQYFAESYGKIDAILSKKINKFPKTFVIQLKRFNYSLQTQHRTKITKQFQFPQSFNTKDYFENETNSCPSIEYVLKGVVVHTGSSEGGHYNSIIKIDGKWVNFNDSEVEVLDDKRFDSLTMGGSARKSCAYLLFYVALDQENETKDVQIPKELCTEIEKENDSFKKMNCLLSQEAENLILETHNIDIIMPYFLNAFVHSSLVKHTIKLTQEINSLTENDRSKGFDFFFDTKFDDQAPSKHDCKDNLSKTINILISGSEYLADPFLYLLNSFINGKSKTYSKDNIDEEKMKYDTTILLLLLKSVKEKTFSCKNSEIKLFERLGKLVNQFVESYKDLFVDPQIKSQICIRIIDIIYTFYQYTTNETILNQANLSYFFTILSNLNSSIENVKIFDDFIDEVKKKIKSSSASYPFYNQLIKAINKRKGIETEVETSEYSLRPFDYNDEFSANLRIEQQIIEDFANYMMLTMNTTSDSYAILTSIDDSDELISYLSSTNFNPISLLNICANKSEYYDLNSLCALLYQKPIIITRMSILADFDKFIDYFYQYAFQGLNPTIASAYTSPQLADPLYRSRIYKYIIDSFKLLNKMKNYPWYRQFNLKAITVLHSLISGLSSYLTKSQMKTIFELVEYNFLSFTSYIDEEEKTDNKTNEQNDIFAIHGKERRKHISMSSSHVAFSYLLFDLDLRIESFDKYSKYYIFYLTVIPIKEKDTFDFIIITIFEKVFIMRPDLFLRLLKSDIILYPLQHSSQKEKFIKFTSTLMKIKEVAECVILELMPKVPLTVILEGVFLRMAVDNLAVLTSNQEMAEKLASSFIYEFFKNVKTVISKNRFFSSSNDLSKIVGCLHNFELTEDIKTAFIDNFLIVFNQSNFSKAASDFIASLSSQKEEFAKFVVSVLTTISDSKSKEDSQTVTIENISVKNDVISSQNCWKIISSIVEYLTDFENSIVPVVKSLTSSVESMLGKPFDANRSLIESQQMCFEKLALFIDESNHTLFKELFIAVLGEQSIKISDQIACFLIEVINCLPEKEKSDLVLGTAIYLSDPDDAEPFMHSFKITVLLIQNMQNKKQMAAEIRENYEEIYDRMDEWPQECNEFKDLFL